MLGPLVNAFDNSGNRTIASRGGDQNGSNLRPANYTANNLNQYTQRTVPGYVDVLGTANSNANVMVESVGGWYALAYRKGEYFRAEVPLDNSGAAVWLAITNIAVLPGGTSADIQTNATGNVLVPRTPEPFYYDKDGNLTNDGRWEYTWDAENRLVSMAASSGVGPTVSLKFEYDSRSRRIRKQVWGNTTWTGSPTNDLKFLYDGWNLVAIFNSPSSLLESFLWGADLSGSQQGAGGVGGLLEVVSYGTSTTNCFAAFDGNGNMVALINAADGTLVAQYDYGPFGELLRATGPMANLNPVRFSSRYQDTDSDLVYYGYRYLSVLAGRWISRDPLGEKGGNNEYAILENQVVGQVDRLGRKLAIDRSGQPEFRDRMLRCLCALARSRRGYQLIEEVQHLPETWIIVPVANGAAAPSTGNEKVFIDSRAINGVGPDNVLRLKYPDEVPPDNIVGCAIVLGHEFGHVLDEEDEYYSQEENPPPGMAGKRREPPDNNNVANNENPVRQFFGVGPRRTYHGYGPIPAPN